jgi:hypothetical protein
VLGLLNSGERKFLNVTLSSTFAINQSGGSNGFNCILEPRILSTTFDLGQGLKIRSKRGFCSYYQGQECKKDTSENFMISCQRDPYDGFQDRDSLAPEKDEEEGCNWKSSTLNSHGSAGSGSLGANRRVGRSKNNPENGQPGEPNKNDILIKN